MADSTGCGARVAPQIAMRWRLRPGRRARPGVFLAAATLILAWSGGFAWFVVAVQKTPGLPAHADGIVVLTGGADRISDALRLLSENRADGMLVTGIGGGAALRDLAEHAKVDTRALARRITLGRGAASTHGNAAETAAWVQENGIRSLIVVTAFYHIPRALLEMARALPRVQLFPAPVRPPSLELTSWTGMRLLAGEYAKLIAAAAGLTAFEHDPGPILSTARPSSRRT